MSFDFASQDEQTLFISLKGLCNKNQGFFKSVKQAQFLFRQYSERFDRNHTRDQVTTMWAVPVADDQITVEAMAYTRWADYGSRSVIPVLYVFVLDQLGVVAHYKVGGKGNLRDGWAPEASKTRVLWQRDSSAVAPFTWPTEAQVAAQEADKSNQWLGQPGDKIEVELKFVRCRDLGYSQFGQMFISMFEDAQGNAVNVWKYFDLNAGSTLKVRGTIKSTDDYRGRRQTTITRVKAVA